MDLTNIDPFPEVRAFLLSKQRSKELQGEDNINITITTQEFQESVSKLSDRTASSPSGRHSTHYKVCSKDDRTCKHDNHSLLYWFLT